MAFKQNVIFDGHVEIGGVNQYLNICGQREQAPVLLLVHGGPGFSDLAFARHGYNRLLEGRFVVVTWDQRGTGRSFSESIPPESMKVEQLISDGGMVAEWLCRHFDQDKIFIRGHSWGGYLGMRIISRFPQMFHAYFALSPYIDYRLSEPISYKFAYDQAKTENHQDALKELDEIGAPPYEKPLQALQIQRKWLEYFGGMVFGGRSRSNQIFALFSDIPGFNKDDYIQAAKGQEFTTRALFMEGLKRSLFAEVKAVDIPLFFGVGRFDYLNCFELTERYFQDIQASKKELIWFEKSAHFPHFSEAEGYQRILIEKFSNQLL